jgi:hypothetical protein
MRTCRKLAATLFLFVLLSPWAASAAGSKARPVHKPAKAELTLASLGSRVRALVTVWAKEGLGIDPSGNPASAPGPGSQNHAGLGIDPSGRSSG